MNSFNVGSKVAVYGFDSRNFFNEGSEAVVTRLVDSASIWVKYDDADFPEAEVHVFQCKPVELVKWDNIGYSGAV